MKIVEYPDRDLMMIDLANMMAGELNAALMTRGTASMAVPGGTTPGPVFDALCAADVDWSSVQVMLSDERRVAQTSERSNARLVRERLLVNRAAAANFVPFEAETDADLAALCTRVAGHLPLDLLLLGMGGDMHTASLFPGAPELAAALDDAAPEIVTMTPPDGLEPRLTLSARVLSAATSVHVLITGAEKRAALETAATTHDAMLAPIGIVLQDATIHWAE